MAGISNIGVPSFRNPMDPGIMDTAKDRADITREEFFKILITELKSQDPMEPMKSQDFMGQLAQLEMLNGQAKMTEGVDSLVSTLRFGQLNDASSMLGKVVVGSLRQQARDMFGLPRFDLAGNPMYEDVPVEGLAERVLMDEEGNTSILLMAPVLDAEGIPATDADGNIITREVIIGIDSVTQIIDPLINMAAAGTPQDNTQGNNTPGDAGGTAGSLLALQPTDGTSGTGGQ